MAPTGALLATLVIVLLTPRILGYLSRGILRLLGLYLQGKTKARREAIWSRVKTEEIENQTSRHASTTKVDDEDWERVESYVARSAANGGSMSDEEWEGIIGFFHPFW